MLEDILEFAKSRDEKGLARLLPSLSGNDLHRARLHLHTFEYERGDTRSALRGLAWVLEHAQDAGILCEAHTHSGHAFQLVGSLKHSERHFRSAVEVAPDGARRCDAMNGLARFFWDAFAFHEAKGAYAVAAEDHPTSRAALNSQIGVAKCNAQLGMLDEAERGLRQAQGRVPGARKSQAGYFWLRVAEVLGMRRDWDGAEGHLRLARDSLSSAWMGFLCREVELVIDRSRGRQVLEALRDLHWRSAASGFQIQADRAVLLICSEDRSMGEKLIETVAHPAIRMRCLSEVGDLTAADLRTVQSRMTSRAFDAVISTL